jgi:hypothetical protein
MVCLKSVIFLPKIIYMGSSEAQLRPILTEAQLKDQEF